MIESLEAKIKKVKDEHKLESINVYQRIQRQKN